MDVKIHGSGGVDEPERPFFMGNTPSSVNGITGLQNHEMRSVFLGGRFLSVSEGLPNEQCHHDQGDDGSADGAEEHSEEGSSGGAPRFLDIIEREIFSHEDADGGAEEEADGTASDQAEDGPRESAKDPPASASEFLCADRSREGVEGEGDDGEERQS